MPLARFEDMQDLPGHKNGRIATHYSAAEIGNLIEAANRVVNSRNTREQVKTPNVPSDSR